VDIFLVRHGEAAAGWGQSGDPGLSARGQQQALAAARELQPRMAPGTQLLTSPMARARETAQPLADLLSRPAETDPAFSEIPAPVPLSQRQEWLRAFMGQRWRDQSPEVLAWRDHALARLEALTAPAVVFTHFLIINAVVGAIRESAETLCFWPDNGSITHLRRDGTDLHLVALGTQMQTAVN